MATLFSEWTCGRCPAACIAEGHTQKEAVEAYQQKMHALTQGPTT
jgi:hypothetical protein